MNLPVAAFAFVQQLNFLHLLQRWKVFFNISGQKRPKHYKICMYFVRRSSRFMYRGAPPFNFSIKRKREREEGERETRGTPQDAL